MTRWLATLVGLIGGLLAPLADAATYTLPGALPPGCTGSAPGRV